MASPWCFKSLEQKTEDSGLVLFSIGSEYLEKLSRPFSHSLLSEKKFILILKNFKNEITRCSSFWKCYLLWKKQWRSLDHFSCILFVSPNHLHIHITYIFSIWSLEINLLSADCLIVTFNLHYILDTPSLQYSGWGVIRNKCQCTEFYKKILKLP